MPYTEKDVAAGVGGGSKMKVLLVGPPKSGKTSCACLTLPQPLYVISCDPGGLISPFKLGAKFTYDEVYTLAQLKAAVSHAVANKAKYKSILLDTVTILSQSIESEIMRSGVTGWDVYRELKKIMVGQISQLIALPMHVVLTAHMDTGSSEAGILPMMSGQTKTLIPALCNDWILLDVQTPKGSDKDKTVESKREFVLSAEGSWKAGCRSIQNGGRIEADFGVFLKKAGMKP